MLPNTVHVSTDRLTAAAVRCAWRQWSALGAVTHSASRTDEIVDVEALVLASLGLASHEPRLRSLAVDWCVKNSELLSIARLRALFEGPFAAADFGITELAHRVATEGGDARWRAFLPKGETRTSRDGAARLRHSKASTPRWRNACTLLLQLRRGLGVGIKPDLVALLFGVRGTWSDVSTLAELTHYSVAGLRRAADEMADAGLIETSGGHRRAFRAELSAWKALLPNIGAPVWKRRADGFAFALSWQRYVLGKSNSDDSELSIAISFGSRMSECWPLWLEAGVTQQPLTDDPTNAWAPRNAAIEELIAWFDDRTSGGADSAPAN